ncbi:acyl-CoA dehydrogenase family protein [Pendulispora rubella]|uniref:Acyl-CoA dehydrogenase family protein n=1 Tax=Pendulispora rubella TaxID=2741070 RepID=A0ABZ2KPK3_9BACT
MTTSEALKSIAGGASEVLRAVEALVPMTRAECADIDVTRAIPVAVVRALQAAGVHRMLVPKDFGGAEIDPVTFLRVVEATAYADGSVGWCVAIGGCYGTFGGMLPAEGARRIFGEPEAIVAGAFRPTGAAIPVDGGFRVTGRWPLASGSTHATWYLGGCTIVRDGKPVVGPTGIPLMREMFFPASAVNVIDTWESTGLRGTASHDYAVSEVFVPASLTAWFSEPPICGRPLFRMPPIATFATFLGAVPLGIARHALEEFITLATGKTSMMSTSSLADKPVAQDRLGRAKALILSGRHYLVETLRELWDKVQAGHAPSMSERGALWLAATHAAHTALEAIELLYTAAGASSVYRSCPLDRCLRDARTAVQHLTLQEMNFELAGRDLLGRALIPSPWATDYRGEP